eukprot:5261181-Amphidinium_carterae.1
MDEEARRAAARNVASADLANDCTGDEAPVGHPPVDLDTLATASNEVLCGEVIDLEAEPEGG